MRVLFIFLIFLALVGCASSENQKDTSQDIQEAASDTGDTGGTPAVNGNSETSEADLQGDNGQTASNPPPPGEPAEPPAQPGEPQAPPPTDAATAPADQTTPPAPDQAAPPPQADASQAENPPPPAAEEPAPAPAPAPEDNGQPAVVTGLDFKANENGGSVVVHTNNPVQYTTRHNADTNQFVIELHNTTVPKRFQRPYPTKDFPGPIGSINAYQSQGTHEARIVVQLRENVEPSVIQAGNVITVAGAGGGGPQVSEAPAPQTPSEAQAEQTAQNNQDQNAPAEDQGENAEAPPASGKDTSVIREHTLNDFLTGNTKFYGRPISLEVKDADIHDVLRLISEETGLNIVVGDDVTGKVTMKLRQIPWDQALAVLLQSKELGYVKQGAVLRIAPLKTLQSESDAAAKVIESQHQLEPLHVQVFPISYASAKDMELQAKDFLSTRGKVRSDPRTNNLVVTDIDENLQRIKQLVQRLDTQTPQVLIEAKIVEARETYEKLIGTQWGASGGTINLGNNSSNQSVVLSPSINSGITAPNLFTQAGFTLGTLDVLGNLSATLSLLESEQLVHVISAPRIVTLDRQEADIQQTTQFPIFTVTPTTTTTIPLVSISFQDVKLDLTVTPQITMDGSIIMAIHVIREYADPPTNVNGSQARAVNKREAKTQVLVESGDTVVIGGIYQSDVTDEVQGVPWLSKLPLIGELFKQSDLQRDKNELVIFLTPRTLNREKAFLKQGGNQG